MIYDCLFIIYSLFISIICCLFRTFKLECVDRNCCLSFYSILMIHTSSLSLYLSISIPVISVGDASKGLPPNGETFSAIHSGM